MTDSIMTKVDGYMEQLVINNKFSGSTLTALEDNIIIKKGCGIINEKIKSIFV